MKKSLQNKRKLPNNFLKNNLAFKLIILFSICFGIKNVHSQTTYYWVGTASADWNTGTNWNTDPNNTGTARITPANTDILIIDGDGTTSGAATTLVMNGNDDVGQLLFTNNVFATISGAVTATTYTININGGTGTDLDIPIGSTFKMDSLKRIVVNFVGTGNYGLIAGTFINGGGGNNTGRINANSGTATLVDVTGTVTNYNTAVIPGTLNGTAASLHFIAGSTYNFINLATNSIAVNIPVATWDTTSTINITSMTTTSNTTSNSGQSFGNVNFNCPAQGTATQSLFGFNTTEVKGNLNIMATGTSPKRVRLVTTGNLTVLGDYNQTGGIVEAVSMTGTVTFKGNVNISAGTFDITFGTSSAKVNAEKDVLVTGTGIFTQTGVSTTSLFTFQGTNPITFSPGTVTSQNIRFRVNNPSNVNMTVNVPMKDLIVSSGNIIGTGIVAYTPTSTLTYNGTTTQNSTTNELSVSSNPLNLVINNTGTAPANTVVMPQNVTLASTTSTLTLTSGNIDNQGFTLTINNPLTTAIVGGSASSYVMGGLSRAIDQNLTGTTDYVFPVGKTTYNPYTLSSVNSGAGVTLLTVENKVGPTGGTTTGLLSALNTDMYWATTVASTNFITDGLVKLEGTLGTADAIGFSSTLAGAYSIVGSIPPTVGTNSILSTAPGQTNFTGFFAMGKINGPMVSNLTILPIGNLCTNVAREVRCKIVAGAGALTTKDISYTIDGGAANVIALAPVAGFPDSFVGTIPTVSPVNGLVDWKVIATDANFSESTLAGTSYKDEPNFGVVAPVFGATILCNGDSTVIYTPEKIDILSFNDNFNGTFPTANFSTFGTISSISAQNLINVDGTNAVKMTYLNNDNGGMQTNTINLAGKSNLELNFDQICITEGGWDYGYIEYSIDNGATWLSFPTANYTGIGTLADVGVSFDEGSYVDWANPATNTMWKNETITLPANAYTSQFKLRFRLDADGFVTTDGWYIDNIKLINKVIPTSHKWSYVGTAAALSTNDTFTYLGVNTTASPVTYDIVDSILVNGCVLESNTLSITINPTPTTPVATNSTHCGNQIPTASVSSSTAGNYSWFADSTSTTALQDDISNTYLSSVSVTDTFWVSVKDPTTSCVSQRAKVIVTVTIADTIKIVSSSANDSICLGSPITLTYSNPQNSYTYTYASVSSTGSGVEVSTAGSPLTFTPTEAGTYIYNVTSSETGGCTNSKSYSLTVSDTPTITSFTIDPAPVCIGAKINLKANSIIPNTTMPWHGDVNALGTNFSSQAIFSGGWGGYKSEHIFTAAELIANGYLPGNITAIDFDMTSTSGIIYNDFAIKMGHTTLTQYLTDDFQPGLAVVYNMAPVTPVNGVNNLVFNTPFVWDGVSNIILSMSWSSGTASNFTSSSFNKFTPSGFNSSISIKADNVSGTDIMNHVGDIDVIGAGGDDGGVTNTGRPNIKFYGSVGVNYNSALNWTYSPAVDSNTYSTTDTYSNKLDQVYTVTATNPITGCLTSAQATLDTMVTPMSVVDNSISHNKCIGTSDELSVSVFDGCTPYTYTWKVDGVDASNDNDTLTFNVLPGAHIYTLTVTSFSGVTYNTTFTITGDTIPTATIFPASASPSCGNSAVKLYTNANPTNYSIVWQNNLATVANISLDSLAIVPYASTSTDTVWVNPTDAFDVYSLIITDNVTLCKDTFTKTVDTFANIYSTITATPTVLCANGSVQLIDSPTINLGYKNSVVATPLITVPVSETVLVDNSVINVPLSSGSLDDGTWSNIALPFTIDVNGSSVNTISIITNGYIGLGTTVPTLTKYGANLPSGNIPYFAPLNMDYDLGASGKISYFIDGIAPNRKFVVNFSNVPFWNNALSSSSFQAVINENGSFEALVGNVTCNNGNNNTTIGLNLSSTLAITSIDATCGTIISNTSYKIEKVNPVFTYQWSSLHANPLSSTTIYNPISSPFIANDTFSVIIIDTVSKCSKIDTVSVNLSTTPLDITAVNSSLGSTICISDSTTLSVDITGGCFPFTYEWKIADSNSAIVASDPTYKVAPTTSTLYYIRVKDNNNLTTSYDSIRINVNNPIPVAPKVTICNTKASFNLSATPSSALDSIYWYIDSSDVFFSSMGQNFTTPELTSTDTFWAQQSNILGVASNSTGFTPAYAGATGSPDAGLYFSTILPNITINSVDMYLDGTGTVDIELRDAVTGAVIAGPITSATFTSVIGTKSVVPITPAFQIPTIGNYLIVCTQHPGFTWNWSNTFVAPAPSNGLAIVGSHRWGVPFNQESAMTGINYSYNSECRGTKIPVIAELLTPPVLTISKLSDTVCAGATSDTITITSTLSNYNTYTWNTTDVTTIAADKFVFNSTTPGSYSYILTGEQTSGSLCKFNDTFTYSIGALPLPFNANFTSPVQICNGNDTLLKVKSGNSFSSKVGAGTISSGSNGTSPYNLGWHDQRAQYLYTATELLAAGYTPGNLTELGFVVTAVSTIVTEVGDLSISVGFVPSAQTTITGYETGLTNVFTSSSLATPSVGNSLYPISTPIVWDGLSNLVVEVCKNDDFWDGNIDVESTTMPSTVYSSHRDNDLDPCNKTLTNIATPADRPNLLLTISTVTPTIWTPMTNLFIDQNSLLAYTGNGVDSIWAAPNDTIKYYYTATSTLNCSIKDSITINVTDTITITTNVSKTVNLCQSDSFGSSILATSTSPITYQWKKWDGTTFANTTVGTGSTNDTFSISNVSLSDSGKYIVEMTTGGPCGMKYSDTITLSIGAKIVISQQPNVNGTQTICGSGTATISTSASNDVGKTWYKIQGAGAPAVVFGSLDTNTFSPLATDSGRYFAVLTATAPCMDVNTDTVQLNVINTATVTSVAGSDTVCKLGSLTLSGVTVDAASGYAWLKDGVAVVADANHTITNTGTTGSTLAITNATSADNGSYKLVAIAGGACPNDTSNDSLRVLVNDSATVSVTVPASACQGTKVTMTSTYTNAIGFLWNKDAAATTNTTDSLIIASAASTDAGSYSLVVTAKEGCPNVTSTASALAVIPAAVATSVAGSDTVCKLGSLTLSGVTTDATGYTWLKDGVAVVADANHTITNTGATGSTLAITNATSTDNGVYKLIAISAGGCINDTSNDSLRVLVNDSATVSVTVPASACQGTKVTMTSTYTNAIGFLWNKDAAATGTITDSLIIASAASTDAGSYSLVVTAKEGCPNVTSTASALAVIPAAVATSVAGSDTVCKLGSLTLSGVTTDATGYTWIKDGVAVVADANHTITNTGATGSTLAITNATSTDNGVYKLIAISAGGCINDTSNDSLRVLVNDSATVSVTVPASACQGTKVTMTSTYTNAIGFLWNKDAAATGTITDSLIIASAASTDAGSYSLVVTAKEGCPNVTSTASALAVIPAAVATSVAGSDTVCKLGSLTLSGVTTDATGYTWLKDGVAVVADANHTITTTGATGSTLAITNATSTDNGVYKLVALTGGTCPSDTSNDSLRVLVNDSATVSVTVPASACQGTKVTMTSTYTNAIGFAWNKDAAATGTITDSLIIASAASTDAGSYSLVVTAKEGCPNVTSTASALAVIPAAVATSVAGSDTVCKLGSLTLSGVTTDATGYTWIKDGVAVVADANHTITTTGATGSTLAITNATSTDNGVYKLVALTGGSCPSDTSNDSLRVLVNEPLSLSAPTANTTLCQGNTYTNSVTITGTGLVSYQWFDGSSTLVSSGTGSPATLSTTAIANNTYTMVASTTSGCPNVTSSVATLTVNTAPSKPIVAGANSIADGVDTICTGGSTSLTTTGTNNAGYVWTKGSTQVSTSANYTATTSGIYTITAKGNTGCSDSSVTFEVKETTPAAITVQPVSLTNLQAGQNTTLRVTATNASSYQWYKDGVLMGGETKDSLVITNFDSATHAGKYTVEVTGILPCTNVILSNESKIESQTCPMFTTQPLADTVCEGGSVVLTATASTTSGYEWYKGTSKVSSNQTYTISNATASKAGWYKAKALPISGVVCPNVFSDSVYISVDSKIKITSQPQPINTCNATSHTMSVTATGTSLSYQWYKDGLLEVDSINPTYTITNLNTVPENYYVEVTSSGPCPAAVSDTIEIKNRKVSEMVVLNGATYMDLVEQCTDSLGWTYYSRSNVPEELLFAIRKNGNTATFAPDLEINNKGVHWISHNNNRERIGSVIGSRMFNVDLVSGSIQYPYDVRFFFSPSDTTAINTEIEDKATANNPGKVKMLHNNISMLTSTLVPFTSTLLSKATSMPLNFYNTIVVRSSYGKINGVSHVDIYNLVAENGGGSMYKDYKVNNTSGIEINVNKGMGVSIYPVPANTEMTIELTSNTLSPITMTITDMTGRVIEVKEERHQEMTSEHKIDVSSYSTGTYNVSITNGESITSAKFTVDR